MRTYTVGLLNLTNRIIPIGYEGENLYTQVRIDCEELFRDYPNATAGIAIQGPDGEVYPAAVTKTGNDIVWTITSSFLGEEGAGLGQLTFVDNETVIKSEIFHYVVYNSLVADGEMPDPVEDWITEANNKLCEVEAAVEQIPETIDAALAYAKASGEFDGDDGFSPVVSVTEITDGHRVSVTDAEGTESFDVMNGDPGQPGQPGAPGQPGQDGVSPTVSVTPIADGNRVTITDKTGPHSFDVMDGEKGDPGDPGDPTELIDDTSTTATDKVWSAKKSADEVSDLKSAINQKQDAPETAGTAGQVLGLDSNLDPVWLTPSGSGGIIDDELSTSSTNPVQNKVLTKEIRKAELVKNDLSAWLYAENKYLNTSYELTDLTGYNLYRIQCEHLDYVSLLWTGSTPFGTLGGQYRYTFEDNNGYRRDLTSYNIKFESGKVMFIAPPNAIAIYFCFKADTLANLSVIKNTPREYAPANDVAKSFIIPINNKTAVNAGFYLSNANSGIYTWDNASYPIWWIKVGKGDTIKFKDNVSGLSYNAVQMNTSDTIATISAKEYTFATDAVVCIFEQASNPNNCVIIPIGSKLQIDASDIYNSPFENTFNGVNGVAFGTSLTYRAQTTGGYLQYLPALSGITFDNQGVGSSVILGDGGNYDMLAKIKSYTGYSGKKVCIIEGFVNDWYNYKTLGTWKDTAETSVCGCVRSALNYVLSQNANMTVFLVLDPYGRNYDNVDCSSTAVNESSLTQYEYYSEIAKVAESLGIPVIKMFAESQISENTPQFMLDNIHPNALGAKQSAYFIWGKMKQYYANQVS